MMIAKNARFLVVCSAEDSQVNSTEKNYINVW